MTRPVLRTYVLLSAMTATQLAGGCESGVPGQRVGDIAPDISGQTFDGKMIRVSDHRGKVVLVDFWGTWCGPCRSVIPATREKVTGPFAGRPFVIVGVAMDEPDTVRLFSQRTRMPWDSIADPDNRVGKQWDIDGWPTFILLDHEGVIRDKQSGVGDLETLWKEVEVLVKEAEKK